MNINITREDWLDPQLEPHPAELRLARLWLRSNPEIDLCGAFLFSPARFRLQTGLDPHWAEQAMAAFSSVFRREGDVIWVSSFIRHQIGVGASLVGRDGRPNRIVYSVLTRIGLLPQKLRQAAFACYPELEAVAKPSMPCASPAATPSTPSSPPSPVDGGDPIRSDPIRSNPIRSGESEGGEGVPDEAAVVAYAHTWPGDLARGVPGPIPDGYALRWFSWRTTTSPFPRDWRGDLRRRFTADWVNGKPEARAGTEKNGAISRAELDARLEREPDPQERARLRRQFREQHKPA
jgi:hypothetical protein